ncbi:hypothetical protein GPA27_02005 [Aromatoleum toluolicum]|uniref:Uncharacterized protein n=1 Tax=Aromatoleum toluolicum TaxID=90060 RepID=A0ABX1NAA2_9RHOO|nr:hypothetical protein [Aromatoleum toluolicum]NMF96169.1 hypothetical protein [Aromatoleum toluolicum]
MKKLAPRTPTSGTEKGRQLRQEADAVMQVIEGANPEALLEALRSANASLRREADRADNPATYEAAVRILDSYTHPDLVLEARQVQAVRFRSDVFLPVFEEGQSALPNCFVRSSLFPGADPEPLPASTAAPLSAVENTSHAESPVSEIPLHEVKVQSTKKRKITLTLEGECLQSYDRRIFAACISRYRDHPLAHGADCPWMELTLGALAKEVCVTRGPTTYAAMRASLIRLGRTTLTVGQSLGKKRITLAPLLEVQLPPADAPDARKVRFRIHENIAELYGRNDWRRIPMGVLSKQGLVGWLGSFYASHSIAKEIAVGHLYKLSGLRCRDSDFPRLLKDALGKLKDTGTPSAARVTSFKVWRTEAGVLTTKVKTATMTDSD